jgi:hypothetical protein
VPFTTGIEIVALELVGLSPTSEPELTSTEVKLPPTYSVLPTCF